MIDLDDEATLSAGDPGGMLAMVAAMPEHCREGYRLGRATSELPALTGVTSVAFCGMGGSALAGDVIRALYADRLGVPVEVVRSPSLPEFCGPHTLVLASSYSGGTAETLACFEEAVRRGCRVIAATSGGELATRADELGVARVAIPSGFLPRAAFGFLALGWLGALEAVGLVPPLAGTVEEAAAELETVAATLVPSVPTPVNLAKGIALAVGDRVPVIWGAEGIGSVAAFRWKTQMNENAKVPAFASSLPELDHNEVLGWSRGTGSRFLLVTLRHEGEHRDVAVRFPLSVEIAVAAGAHTEEIWARGRSPLARLLSLVIVGDFVATYLGLRRGEDPCEMDAIVRLKQALAEASG